MNFIPIKRIAKKLLLKLRLVGTYFYIRQIVHDIQTSGKINHLKQTGELLPPYSFVLETNFACNLRCYFCYQREIHTVNQKWLTPDEIRNFFSNILPEHIHDITLLGGEIFVRNDIFEIFSIFEEMKINFSIITNGTVLNQKKIKKLFDYKYLKKIVFSIHGMEKTHDTIVGAKNSFKKAYVAMNSLSNNRIQTGINMVVTERNFKEIKGIIDLAKELHIDTVHLSTEYSIGIFNFFKNKSKNGSKITKDDYKTYEEQTRIMKKRIHDYLIEARNYALKKQVFCDFPTRLMNDALSLFINKQILKNKNKFNLMCSDLFKVRIDPEGKLTFCFLARNYFGSLREQTLQELINSNTLREARRRIANKQFIPLCEGCCKLEKIF